MAGNGDSPDWFDAANLRALGRLRITTRRPLTGPNRSNRVARRTGASVEFAEHRTYTPGDDPRMLDWNAYGRLDRLYTRLFHDEEDMHVCILLDSSASMRTSLDAAADKFNVARRVAAALAHVALIGQLQVSLGFFAETLSVFSEPLRGRSSFHRILELLDRAPAPGVGTSFASALDTVAAASPRKSLFVVISDFLDPSGIELPLRRLLHRRCDLAMVDVFEPFRPEMLPAGDLLLVDSESGEEVALDAGPESLRLAEKRTATHTESVRRWAIRHGTPLARINPSGSDCEAIRQLIAAGILTQ